MSFRTNLPITSVVQKRKSDDAQVNSVKAARSYNTAIEKNHYPQFDVSFRYLMTVEGNGFSDPVVKLLNQYNQFAKNKNHRAMAEQLNQFLDDFNQLDMKTMAGNNDKLAIRILTLLVQDILEIKLFEHTTMTAKTEVERLQRRGHFITSIYESTLDIRQSMASVAVAIFEFDSFMTRYRNLKMNNTHMLKRAMRNVRSIPVESNISDDNDNVDTNQPVSAPIAMPEPVVTAEIVKQMGDTYSELRVQQAQVEATRNTLAHQARVAIANLEKKTAEDHAINAIALQALQAQRQKAKLMKIEELLSPEELHSMPGIDVPGQVANAGESVDQLAADLAEQKNIQQALSVEVDARIAECEAAAKRQQDYLSQCNQLNTLLLPESVIEKLETKRKAINPATLFANIQTGSELPALQDLVRTYTQLQQQSEESARKIAEKSASITAKTQTLQAQNQRFQGLFNDYVKQVDELERALQATQPILNAAKQERSASPSLGGLNHE